MQHEWGLVQTRRIGTCVTGKKTKNKGGKNVLEVIRDGLFQPEGIVGGRDASADLVVALGPLVAVLLGDERVAEVEEHPSHAYEAVQPRHGLPDEEGDPDSFEDGRDPPHVDDVGAEELAEAAVEAEHGDSEQEGEEDELYNEIACRNGHREKRRSIE